MRFTLLEDLQAGVVYKNLRLMNDYFNFRSHKNCLRFCKKNEHTDEFKVKEMEYQLRRGRGGTYFDFYSCQLVFGV